jgi:hypothetical protein
MVMIPPHLIVAEKAQVTAVLHRIESACGAFALPQMPALTLSKMHPIISVTTEIREMHGTDTNHSKIHPALG